MSAAASGESVLSGIHPVRGCSRGFLGVGGLAAAVCLPSSTGSGTQCPSPTDMGVLCSIPFSTCSWLPRGSHQPRSQGQLRDTGCPQPDLSPGEGMEPEAGWCWQSAGLGWDGRATRAIQPHTREQHPHPMAQGSSAVSGDRGVTPVPAGWVHHQPGCVSFPGTAHGVVVTLLTQTHLGVGLCPAHLSANLGTTKAIGRGCGECLVMGTPGHAGPPLCPALPQGWTHRVPLGFGISPRSVGTRLPTAHPSSWGSALSSISWSSLPVDQRLWQGLVSCFVSQFYSHRVIAVNKTWMNRMEMFQFL